MKQIVYEVVVFLHLLGYRKNGKIKLLSNMYKNRLEIENTALLSILDSIADDLRSDGLNESVIHNIDNFKKRIMIEGEMTF